MNGGEHGEGLGWKGELTEFRVFPLGGGKEGVGATGEGVRMGGGMNSFQSLSKGKIKEGL